MVGTYAEAVEWLYALEAARGMDLKLDRVHAALRALGEPQRKFRSMHVAGTNGKGSVAAMAHSILCAAGYRVGLYTSPHLVRLTERVRVNDALIPEATLVDLVREVRAQVEGAGITLTFFEFMTVLAFVHFARLRVDVAVVEVGLGGRLDATNVIDPEVSVITTIALDHEEFLGTTLASVASEKAGIVKARRPVVIGKLPAEARRVVRARTKAMAADVYEAGRDFDLQATPDGGLSFSGVGQSVDGVKIGLRGHYQHHNAALAIAAVNAMRGRFPVSARDIRHGLETVTWPGRLDVLRTEPLVVTDSAHNPAGMTNLVAELTGLLAGRHVRLLFAAMRDKDWKRMIEILAPHVGEVTLTQVPGERSEPAANLAAEFGRYRPSRVVDDPGEACNAIFSAMGRDEALLVTGSIFLVGAVYETCRSLGSDASRDRAGASPLSARV